MKLLEERILRDGKVFAGDVLKVDRFLNHQIVFSTIRSTWTFSANSEKNFIIFTETVA